MQEIIFRNLSDTTAFASEIVSWLVSLSAPVVIALHGDVGSGKTTLCHAIVSLLIPGAEFAGSPTFSLMHEYVADSGYFLIHMDCYRLKSAEEVFALGIEERFLDTFFLIEWPEVMRNLLPEDAYHISLRRELKEGVQHIICCHNLPLPSVV